MSKKKRPLPKALSKRPEPPIQEAESQLQPLPPAQTIDDEQEQPIHSDNIKNMIDDLAAGDAPRLSHEDILVTQPSFISGEDIEINEPVKTQPDLEDNSTQITSQVPTGDLYNDLAIFMVQLENAFSQRYDHWERTSNSLMNTLKKMDTIMGQNIDTFLISLEQMKILLLKGFKDFVKKRDEVERFSNIDYKSIAKDFQKTLDLLNFQIIELKLHQDIDELYAIYQ